jgi:glycosyltransferase involved in cell wall biosynthesis
MNQEKISVIVPVYNAEKYLNRCVKSILKQTWSNLDVLLVNDGSTDASERICSEWEKKDPRVRVISKENGGLSDARNAGLDAAEGAYIALIDSDDYIAQDMLQRLMDAMRQADARIGICNFLYVDEDGRPLPSRNKSLPIRDETITGLEAVDRTMQDEEKGWYYVTACNRLYRKDLFADLRFPVGKIHEDEFTAHKLLGQCEKIACISMIGYYYVQHPGSIVHSCSAKTRLHAAEALLDRALFCADRGLGQSAGYAYLKSAVFLCDAFSRTDTTPAFQKEREGLFSALKENRRLLAFCTGKEKLQLGIVFFSPQIYRLVFRNAWRQKRMSRAES